jgi:hypothetical protein
MNQAVPEPDGPGARFPAWQEIVIHDRDPMFTREFRKDWTR